MQHYLLTGEPGIGKSTLLHQFLEKHHDQCVGFYAQEVRVNGNRQGFEVVPVNLPVAGGILADKRIESDIAVGSYKVDLSAIERIVSTMEAMDLSDKILIIDEMGQMQSHSSVFRSFVENQLQNQPRILGTIKLDPFPWTDHLKTTFKDNIVLTEVTLANRDTLGPVLDVFFN